MGTPLRPSHLLLHHEPLTDHLVDRRFGNGAGDRFPMSKTIVIIGNEGVVVCNVLVEVTNDLEQFPAFCRVVKDLQVHIDFVDGLPAERWCGPSDV